MERNQRRLHYVVLRTLLGTEVCDWNLAAHYDWITRAIAEQDRTFYAEIMKDTYVTLRENLASIPLAPIRRANFDIEAPQKEMDDLEKALKDWGIKDPTRLKKPPMGTSFARRFVLKQGLLQGHDHEDQLWDEVVGNLENVHMDHLYVPIGDRVTIGKTEDRGLRPLPPRVVFAKGAIIDPPLTLTRQQKLLLQKLQPPAENKGQER
jgi:hypothetical protein